MINIFLKYFKKFLVIGATVSFLIFSCFNFFHLNIGVTYKIVQFFGLIISFIFIVNIFINKEKKYTYLPNILVIVISIFFLFIYKNIDGYFINYIKLIFIVGLLLASIIKERVLTADVFSKNKEYFFITLIFIIFTLIKLPFFNKNFTGNNTMKYNAYVEPAKHMVENNNFLFFQRKYIANPINNREGFYELNSLPIIEWSLATFYKVFGLSHIVIITRMFMHLIGLAILLFSYLLLKKVFNKTFSLIFIILLTINPLFLLISHLTVYDSFLMLFFIISFIFYEKFLDKKNYKNLAYSGIILGLATLMKNSVFIWSAPTFLIYCFLINKKDFKQFFKEMLIFFLFLLLTAVFFTPSIKNIANNISLSTIFVLSYLLITYLLIKKIKLLVDYLRKILDFLFKEKKILITLILSALFLGIFFFLQLSSNWSEFFTDKEIIFYLPMYKYIFEHRQIYFVKYLIFSFCLLGFLLIANNKEENKRKFFVFSFLFGALFYLIANSKVIYFHNYYNIHIIYAYLLFASYFVSILIKKANFYISSIFLILFISLSLRMNVDRIYELLGAEKLGFNDVVEYVRNNMDNDEFYIDETQTLSITIFTNTPCISNIDFPEIKEDIQQIGFNETMKKYKIKYLITNNEQPSYQNYLDIFSGQNTETNGFTNLTRTDLILKKNENLNKIKILMSEMKSSDYFRFETRVGSYKIYNLYGN